MEYRANNIEPAQRRWTCCVLLEGLAVRALKEISQRIIDAHLTFSAQHTSTSDRTQRAAPADKYNHHYTAIQGISIADALGENMPRLIAQDTKRELKINVVLNFEQEK